MPSDDSDDGTHRTDERTIDADDAPADIADALADAATESDGHGDARTSASMGRRGYLKSAAVTAATGLGIGALSSSAAAHGETITSNQTGNHDGYWYSFWTDDEGSVTMTLEEAGHYTTDWNTSGNFVCGLGWSTGSRRNIEYNASSFDPGSNGYLCVYGWTTDPLVEYYILEDYGPYTPGDDYQGTVNTDGGTYEIYTSLRENAPSIEGNATFEQYWSIRQNTRRSGTITTGNHFDAWQNNGMNMGSHDYQIMATEGYQSSGNSNVTIGSSGGGGDGGGGDDGGGDDGSGGGSGSGGSTSPPSNGTYSIQNVNSGAGMDVAGQSTDDGANVQQYSYWGGENQQWNVQDTGGGEFVIENVNSGKVLDVANQSTADGANVHQYADGGGDNQRFYISDQGSGQYHIQPVHSQKAVEVENSSTSDGANVQQYDWNGNDNQLWTFESV